MLPPPPRTFGVRVGYVCVIYLLSKKDQRIDKTSMIFYLRYLRIGKIASKLQTEDLRTLQRSGPRRRRSASAGAGCAERCVSGPLGSQVGAGGFFLNFKDRQTEAEFEVWALRWTSFRWECLSNRSQKSSQRYWGITITKMPLKTAGHSLKSKSLAWLK